MNRTLDVFFHEVYVGKLRQNNYGQLSFQYDERYVSAKNSPSISLLMPVKIEIYEGDMIKAYFSGLLPDDIARHRLARYLGLSEKNPFALLKAIGGECAGALSFYPEGEPLPKITTNDSEKLDDQKLREILDLLKRRPLMAGSDNLRLSLAGAQDKIAVGIKDDAIILLKGGAPTSHILKPMIDEVKDSVHNEVFCMRLAKLLNIDTPRTQIRWLDNTPYFLIERYDRTQDKNQTTKRLHQEDFCQALGIMPELKYEREGGPSIKQCLDLLQEYSFQPAKDQLAFIERLIFNYIIGNADAHGKNYSLLYKDQMPILAPAYDLLCTAVYPNFSLKMAMKIGKKYEPDHVLLRHWSMIVPDTTAAKKNLEKKILRISQECLNKAYELKSTLRDEGIDSSILNDICNVIKGRAEHIADQFN